MGAQTFLVLAAGANFWLNLVTAVTDLNLRHRFTVDIEAEQCCCDSSHMGRNESTVDNAESAASKDGR